MAPLPIRADATGVSFDALITPRAARARFGPQKGDRIAIFVTAPPVDGEANAQVIAFVAKVLDVPRRAVTITAGERGRRKTIHVDGVTAQTLSARLAADGD
jgi:hypothetical protein